MDKDNQLVKLFQNLKEIPTARPQKKYLIVTLGDHQYCLEVGLAAGIVSITKMLKGPDIPSYVKGILNWHGSKIPVFEIRTQLDSPPRKYDRNSCIAVMKLDGKYVGLVVDQTNEVADLNDEQFLLPLAQVKH